MDNKDLKKFSEIMVGMGELYGSSISSVGLDLIFEALKTYSIDQIKVAAHEILRTRKYTKMPTVADFITLLSGDKEHADEDMAELQAMAVINEIRRIGSSGSPKFYDHVTADIIKRRFGWDTICAMPTDQTSFFVRDFKAAYLAYKREDNRQLLELENIDGGVKRIAERIGKTF